MTQKLPLQIHANLPGDLERSLATFIDRYNHRRCHESPDNLTTRRRLLRTWTTQPGRENGGQAKDHRETLPSPLRNGSANSNEMVGKHS